MNRNRVVQLVAIGLGVGCLAGTSLLTPAINRQRESLIDNQVVENLDPKYALLAAMGSFRGLAVDALWYQAEMAKRDGNYFDAKAKRDLIVTLQPRFPQVWRFQAWDMAYNISVGTHTADERWDWVHKGIRLLRDEGIPNNPDSVELYRELAWIFFHKVGQYSDDFHWYYKQQIAQEWQELLGAPTEGATTQQVLEEFRPIVDAAENYLTFDEPSRTAKAAMQDLIGRFPDQREELEKALKLPLVRFVDRIDRLQGAWREEHPELAEALTPVLNDSRERLARATADPASMLYEESPEARGVAEQLFQLGLSLDANALRRIGRLQMLERYADLELIRQRASEFLDETDRKLLEIVVDPRNAGGLRSLLAFMRAKVVMNDYHMDPSVMYEVMQSYGPVDWRHPTAHGLYWADLGMERAGRVRDRSKIDWLNTARQRIHNIQELTRYGRVNYDPISRRITMLPDPRFIEMYDQAMQEAIEASKQYSWDGGDNTESFQAGHENFLQQGVLYAYIYGDEREAQRYYDRVRKLYGHLPHNLMNGEYKLPLADFVATQLQRDWDMTSMAPAWVDGMLQQAFMNGLANGDARSFNRFMEIAQKVHTEYNQRRANPTPNAPRERLTMPPFPQMVADSYIALMQRPGMPITEKSRIYYFTPPPMQTATYPRFYEAVRKQAEQEGIDADRAFPRPPGLENMELKPQDVRPDAAGTIEVK